MRKLQKMIPVNTNNLPIVFNLIENLTPATTPIFGVMTSQHMVEHLTWTIQFSNGVNPQTLIVSESAVDANKKKFLDPTNPYPNDIRSTMIGKSLPELNIHH